MDVSTGRAPLATLQRIKRLRTNRPVHLYENTPIAFQRYDCAGLCFLLRSLESTMRATSDGALQSLLLQPSGS